MEELKTRAIRGIEKKMDTVEGDPFRYHVLERAKNFKTSWIELGRALYTVSKEKRYRQWGYGTLEAYAAKEIGLRKETVLKLLRSYYFLEKEEPVYLQQNYLETAKPAAVPSYEAVDVLRLAKGKKTLDEAEYNTLKKEVFEKGSDVREVRRDLTAMIRRRQELDPEEAREKRRTGTLRRFIGTLKALKQELELARFAPPALVKDASNLIKKLEAHIASR